MAGERIRSYLDEHHVKWEEREHPVAYTAHEVAQSEGVSGWLVAKPVLLWAEGHLVMVVLPAPMQVDLQRAKEAVDAPGVRLATEDEFAGAFPDCEIGAEPPFGNLYDIPVYVDRSLLDDPYIVFNDGTHRRTLRIGLADYLRLVEPTTVDVGRPA
jgi:Ala-tRNA(Pro) deacylase